MTKLYVALQTRASDIRNRFHGEDEGAAAIEYGLIAGLIALGLVVGAELLGDAISNLFSDIAGDLDAL